MLISKYHRKFFKIIIISQILNIFLITSCTLNNSKENYRFDKIKKQFRRLIIPKGISSPKKKEEYSIPYQDKDLKKENYDIFPPV
ncbi:hypothetical protein [Buchnera aphidicola]|uniref:hypothetical protein n=1 Tax=Buchnera aphidicola TaxID=9 RepID=UPI0001ECFF22|nr:hypothetical protein [Buchnera aphidicola]ADP67071.1 hypothetical protein CWS_00470 [Buchnera aphidicola str. JF99 (Acyrthosiphon pisum)]